MRRAWLFGAIAGLALTAAGALAAPRLADMPGSKAAGSIEVDVELVMAVDISYSMDMDELALQREGYAQAVVSQEFLNALKQGTHGKIAVTLVEWAGVNDQRRRRAVAADRGRGERAGRLRRDGARAGAPRLPHLDLRRVDVFRGPVREQRLSRHPPRDRRLRRRHQQSGPAGHAGARRRHRQGHRHQRPADHAEGAAAELDRYQGPRYLLRGLRDRRPRRVRGADPRAREVQGGDPHQAGARYRALRRSSARHPGGGERAAHLLHHRRADVATPLGRWRNRLAVPIARTAPRSRHAPNGGTDRPA